MYEEDVFMIAKTEAIAWQELDQVLDKYRNKDGAVIPVLQQAQEIFGYLPKKVLIKISEELGVSVSRIYGVVTFYAQFHLEPRGENIIRSCQGTACHVRGASTVLSAIRKKLNLEKDEITTHDRKFTLETVACIGACGLAPCIMINDDTYGRLTPDSVVKILEEY